MPRLVSEVKVSGRPALPGEEGPKAEAALLALVEGGQFRGSGAVWRGGLASFWFLRGFQN